MGAIYDAALDASLWPAFMQKAAGALHAGVGMFWLHDFSTGSADFGSDAGNVASVTGLDATALSQYVSHYSARNVWLPNAAKLPEGSVTVSSSLYPERQLKRTEFYDGWLQGLDVFHGVGSAIVKRETRDVKLSFLRSERAGPYTAGELRMVRDLLPHMRNAVTLHRRLHHLQALSAAALAALDMLPVGVILLTPGGTLMHANRVAHHLAATTRALQFGGGKVLAATAALTGRLGLLIDSAVSTGLGQGCLPGGSLRLTGPLGDELQVLVTPLPVAVSASWGAPAPAAIFCSNPRAPVPALTQALRAFYCMTPAEAELTQALVNGQTLKEFADARGVSINTVRTQLKFAAARVGARRQSDLVRMVLTGPALMRTKAPA
ncbi:MAG: helix-turn-helix transcriptional regulator [Burkholderiales bacterium]|nr:helix-turn-helix transcriptional regulator [Burkholderiales bacterium]